MGAHGVHIERALEGYHQAKAAGSQGLWLAQAFWNELTPQPQFLRERAGEPRPRAVFLQHSLPRKLDGMFTLEER